MLSSVLSVIYSHCSRARIIPLEKVWILLVDMILFLEEVGGFY